MEANDRIFVFAVWAVSSDCKNIDEINEKIVINAAREGINSFQKLLKDFQTNKETHLNFGKII